MNKLKLRIKIILAKYITLKNIIFSFMFLFFSIPFILIFVYGLSRSWFDGLSVLGLLYLSIGVLIKVLDVAQFKTFSKIKNLFLIKKENNKELTKFEKSQMRALNLFDKKQEEIEKEKLEEIKRTINYISFNLVIIGILFLIISLPFIFM